MCLQLVSKEAKILGIPIAVGGPQQTPVSGRGFKESFIGAICLFREVRFTFEKNKENDDTDSDDGYSHYRVVIRSR